MNFIEHTGQAASAGLRASCRECKQTGGIVSFLDGGPEGIDQVYSEDDLRYCEAHGRGIEGVRYFLRLIVY